MGLLTGPASITRYNIASRPEEPAFEQMDFREIQPGSELRESSGFVPMELDAPYRVGHSRFAFRIRFDKVRPDPTAVRERLKQLMHSELELSGAEFIGPKKRKELRQLAEEELLLRTTPTSKIIEGVLDGSVAYIASTAKGDLGKVMELLRRIEVILEPKTPWLDGGDPDLESEVLSTYEPGESVLGCRFLRGLLGDRDLMIEPENGLVKLQTQNTRVTLAGAVLKELYRYVERGAEVLSAKLVTGETQFRFDALPYRINGLRIETGRHDHWTDLLDERLEKIAALWEELDQKYAALRPNLYGARAVSAGEPAASPVASN